jgi:hypothetical protein
VAVTWDRHREDGTCKSPASSTNAKVRDVLLPADLAQRKRSAKARR